MLQVQIRNWHCWKVTCICAVVAREGNDVVKIDMCHHGWGKTFVTVTTNKGNISTGAMVQKDKLGNTYVVSTCIAIIRYFKHTLTCIIFIFKNKPHEHRKQTDLSFSRCVLLILSQNLRRHHIIEFSNLLRLHLTF